MIKYHPDLIQGSDEWIAARCGLITASTISTLVTPALKIASNDKERAQFYEILAQRITGCVEPAYISDDMLRGLDDEILARELYSKKYAEVTQTGFVTNDEFGFTIGFSPDGLVDDDGIIEVKSRRQKFQIQTILDWEVPSEYVMQIQTGLLVTRRKWCDYLSYSGGLPMACIRVFPDPKIQEAIIVAATRFEVKIAEKMAQYSIKLMDRVSLTPTERTIEREMFI
jgi:hypothetical protein